MSQRRRAPYPRLGRFALEGEIARGGMGAVYAARDLETRERVAVKVLLAECLLNTKHRRRLQREIEALARIDHPHVVGLRGAGQTPDGAPFLAMAWVPGESLEARLRGGALGPRQAAQLLAELADAVAAAHAVGLLHRDLKPENVLLTPEGRAVLVDFGLARDMALERSRLTATGAMVGTPCYWAPEQAMGQPEEVGPHTDVFGLGAILFAALTGEPPRQPRSLGEALRLARSPAPAASSVRADVPLALDRLCQRCMALEPADRPQVTELRDALRAWLLPTADTLVQAAAPRPARRRRRWLLAAAGAGLAVTGGALWLSAGSAPPARQTGAALRVESAHGEALDRLERARQDLAQGRPPADLRDLLTHPEREVAEGARVVMAQAIAPADPDAAARLLGGVRASQALPQRAYVAVLQALQAQDAPTRQTVQQLRELDGDPWLRIRVRQAALGRVEDLADAPLAQLAGPLELLAATRPLPRDALELPRLLARVRGALTLERSAQAVAQAELYGETDEVRLRVSEGVQVLTRLGEARLDGVDRWWGIELAGELDLAWHRGALDDEQVLAGLRALLALDVPFPRYLLSAMPQPRGSGAVNDYLRAAWQSARTIEQIVDAETEAAYLPALSELDGRLRDKLRDDAEWRAALGPRVRAGALLETDSDASPGWAAVLEQARGLDPQNPEISLRLAWQAQARQDTAAAVALGKAALAALPLERADLRGQAASDVDHIWGDVAILYAELGELARAHAEADAMARAPWIAPESVSDLRETLAEVHGDTLQASSGWAKGIYGLAR